MIFKYKQKQVDGDIKSKLIYKTLFPTDSVKYLYIYTGVKIEGNLSWKSHIDDLSVKLSRTNALLFKIRNLVNSFILKAHSKVWDNLWQRKPFKIDEKCVLFHLKSTFCSQDN